MNYLFEFVVSVVSSIGFALIFNSPRKTILISGLNGGLGWLIFKLLVGQINSIYIATFVSSFIIAVTSEILARVFHYPASVFIFPGVINLCPGEAIYKSMRFFIASQNKIAIGFLYRSLAIAGAIAFGVMLSSSFSISMKRFKFRSHRRTDFLRSNDEN